MKHGGDINAGGSAELGARQLKVISNWHVCRAALYCIAVVVALMVWVTGSEGLGPIDDHNFIRAIFQGKSFGVYVMPELGRFFPLTAQEYVFAAKWFGPSAQIFYSLNAFKIVLSGGLLFSCLALVGVGNFASAILWSTVMFSMGIANNLFRLHAGEFNALILMLLFAWCVLMLHNRKSSASVVRTGYAVVGVSAFFLALFYKELIFVFGLTFALSEITRGYWANKSKPSFYIVVTLWISVVYIVSYGIWRYIYVTGSYADFHATAPWNVLALYASNDPFIIFVVLPVTAYRIYAILRHPECYSIYDSFMLAASAYLSAFMLLAIFNTYYLLPAYAFAACGLAGILVSHFHGIARRIILMVALLFCVNSFPVWFSDIQAQKMIVNNHTKFVHFLSDWLQAHPETSRQPRNIVLAGVSPGNGVEILHSLKTFLVAFGVPITAFEIKATEPSDNKSITEFHGLQAMQAYRPNIDDLLIFNPYQQVVSRPPLQAPSYRELYRSDSSWALPRWMAWHWIKLCVIHGAECTARVVDNMRYVGYAAMLVTRASVPASEAMPLEAPTYRIGALNMPTRMKSGTAMKFNVLVQNTGTETWPADGTLRSGMFVNLSYRWFNQNNQMVLEGDRAPFPEPMHPGDRAMVSVILKVPKPSGKYKLAIGPVQEGVSWFGVVDEFEIEAY